MSKQRRARTARASRGVGELPRERSHPFDPPAELGTLREREPLSRLAYPCGHIGWLATSHELARKILADPRFSARQELLRSPVHPTNLAEASTGEPAQPGFFEFMDPPEHSRYRRLLAGQFTVRRMERLRPSIAHIVEEHIDDMEASGAPVDLVQKFSVPVPSMTICELLGVPYEDRGEFHDQIVTLVGLEADADQTGSAMRCLTSYLESLVRRKRSERSGDDLLRKLIDGGDLTHEELVGVCSLLLIAGSDSTANMLALGTLALLRNPHYVEELRTGAASLGDTVEELVRYFTIVQYGLPRTALEDVLIDDCLIKAGETVTVSLPAANRDPEKFECPDILNPERDASGHVAFGHGVHRCLGEQFARLVMRTAFSSLFRRLPTLHLAIRPEDITYRDNMIVYGVHKLPVGW